MAAGSSSPDAGVTPHSTAGGGGSPGLADSGGCSPVSKRQIAEDERQHFLWQFFSELHHGVAGVGGRGKERVCYCQQQGPKVKEGAPGSERSKYFRKANAWA